jgi:alpha-beta hydrolase superfamily lysophospholipase
MTSETQRTPTADGTELLVRHWAPAGEPWAFVLLVHGVAEHSGRYEHVGDHLAGAGLDVTAYDLRGFGASGGQRAFVQSWAVVHDDLEAQLAAVRLRAGKQPVVIYGHSMGGLIALGHALTDGSKPDALVLSAPGIEATIPAWKRAIARILSRVAPTTQLKNGLDGAVLSRDPAVSLAYFADPLNCHTTTARLAALAFGEQDRVRSRLEDLSVPALVIHGGADRLVPTASSERLASVPGVTRRTYPDHRHELHNEPDGEAVLDDVIAWLRGRVEAAAVPT